MKKDPDDEEELQELKFLPAIQDFQRRYAASTGNDQKAVRLYREYEPKDRSNRVRNELMAIKKGRVPEKICDNIVGKKRSGKYGSYKHWAELMLLWFVSK